MSVRVNQNEKAALKNNNKAEKKIKHNSDKYVDKVNIIAYLPIIVAFGYIPLIARGYVYEIPSIISEQSWGQKGITVDFFLAYKSFAIIAMGILSIIMVLISLPKKPFKWNKIFIPLTVYVVMVLLSAVISPYRYLAFAGSMETFESALVIVFGYVAIFLATYHFVSYDGMAGVKVLLYGSIPGIFILLIIGLFQFLGMDIFSSEFGKHILASLEMLDKFGDIKFTFEPGTAYATLYNTNFFGFYTAIVSALFFGLTFATKKVWEKVVLVSGLILSIICMFGSKTTTAWLVLVFMITLGILAWAFREKKRGFIVLGCYGLIGVIGVITLFSDTVIGTKARRTLGIGPENHMEMIVKGIDTNENGIDFTFNTGGMHLEYETNKDGGIDLYCTDDKGRKLEVTPISESNNEFIVKLPEGYYMDSLIVRYNDGEMPYIIAYIGTNGKGEEVKWRFRKDEEKNTYVYVVSLKNQIVFPEAPAYNEIFPTMFMTARGSIWNYTLPMLPEHIILGSGANTFIMEYPQNDYLTEQIRFSERSLDIKPHSFYLQQWVENGLVALIGLLIFFGWYIYRAVKVLYKNSWKNGRTMIIFGCVIGVSGWLFSGLANDSNVCTSLPLWCILAIGFAVGEYMIEEKSK